MKRLLLMVLLRLLVVLVTVVAELQVMVLAV